MQFIVEFKSRMDGSIKKHTKLEECWKLEFSDGHRSIYSFVRNLARPVDDSYSFVYKREYISVNDEFVWTEKNGFTEDWLKKELVFKLKYPDLQCS
jgi:hypothetical protein